MDFMRLCYRASGDVAKQFTVMELQLPHGAVEILNRSALTSTTAILEATPQHLLSDLGGGMQLVAVKGVKCSNHDSTSLVLAGIGSGTAGTQSVQESQ